MHPAVLGNCFHGKKIDLKASELLSLEDSHFLFLSQHFLMSLYANREHH